MGRQERKKMSRYNTNGVGLTAQKVSESMLVIFFTLLENNGKWRTKLQKPLNHASL